ncbi:MAG: restriction endonuclease subunit S [Gemmatimonadetes bacterium]|nr:restriction endonuclease subunit S [Gemmatimonadota bacterium]MYG36759.1 restriction endonuclease subunit S [Gemmatimonadota bacterium]
MTTPVPNVDLRPDHWAIVREALRRHVPDRQVLAFGSRATWTAKDYSDLDLAVMGEEPLSLRTSSALDEALGDSDLPFKVDVVDWARTDDGFRAIIRRHGVTVQTPAARSNAAEGTPRTSPALATTVALSDWRESTWGDEISLEYGKARRGHASSTGPFRVFGSNGPIGWTDTPLAPGPGVVLGRKGAYRGVAYSPAPFFVIDTAYYIASKSTHDMRWLFYAIKHYKLGEIDDGSPIPSTTRAAVYPCKLAVPPLHEQRAIACVLGTLDDKIELNRRMNETLEAMARALFKSWFVDFDPVRAKMQGQETGLPDDISDLFPDRLVDSETGEIPEGWDVTTLAERIEVNPRRSLRKGQAAPYLPMAQMPTRGHMPDSVAVRAFGSGMRFANGDTLVARITPCLENGKTAYVDFLADGEIGWGSTEYIVLKPQPPFPSQFAYCLARSSRFRDFAIQNMSGTSGRQRVPPSALREFQMVFPPRRLAARFGEVAESLFERARKAGHESRTLAGLRDALLPKLISGGIRVDRSTDWAVTVG